MAKTKKKKSTKKQEVKTEEEFNRLPQNIVSVGERVEEDKNIYILQSVYKEIQKFTSNKTVNEAGGMLIGTVIEEFGKTNIIISGFVEAKHCEATPTTLKFTHQTWESCHKEIDKKFPGKKIVGWIHTHPNYGIFLSEYDKFIQKNFFSEEYEVAYVIDPIQDIEGFYFWISGKIERCKGFYIYDKTGNKIDVVKNESQESVTTEMASGTEKTIPAIIALSVTVVFLLVFVIILNGKVSRLKEEYEELVSLCNQNFGYVINQMNSINSSIGSPKSDDDTSTVSTDEKYTTIQMEESKPEESSFTQNDDKQINE